MDKVGLVGVVTKPKRLFRPPFQRWRSTRSGARRAGESAISFLQSFFLCGYTAKEKSG